MLTSYSKQVSIRLELCCKKTQCFAKGSQEANACLEGRKERETSKAGKERKQWMEERSNERKVDGKK